MICPEYHEDDQNEHYSLKDSDSVCYSVCSKLFKNDSHGLTLLSWKPHFGASPPKYEEELQRRHQAMQT